MRGDIKQIMTMAPNMTSVKNTIEKLGFPIKRIESKVQKQKRPKFEVNLEPKKDQKVLIGLSYYSSNLIQNMILDGVMGKLLIVYAMESKSGSVTVKFGDLANKVNQM